jgi:hypothetical protein
MFQDRGFIYHLFCYSMKQYDGVDNILNDTENRMLRLTTDATVDRHLQHTLLSR